MSWFDPLYELDAGFLTTCQKCGDQIEAYTLETMKRRKRDHKKECRRRVGVVAQ